MQGAPSNFVDLLSLLLALVISRELAYLLGPYVAIAVLAFGGAGIALRRAEPRSAWRSVEFVGFRVLLAVGMTVALAELLQALIPWANPRITLIPLSFAIGYITDYRAAWLWLWDGVIARFIPKGSSENGK
ncbi:MAG: hypothetical protein ACRCXH_07440 [Shewanella sp.]